MQEHNSVPWAERPLVVRRFVVREDGLQKEIADLLPGERVWFYESNGVPCVGDGGRLLLIGSLPEKNYEMGGWKVEVLVDDSAWPTAVPRPPRPEAVEWIHACQTAPRVEFEPGGTVFLEMSPGGAWYRLPQPDYFTFRGEPIPEDRRSVMVESNTAQNGASNAP